jgi:hypothetical protein
MHHVWLFLVFIGLFVLSGCVQLTKGRAQAFVDCLEIDMSVAQLEERCVPRLQGMGIYSRIGHPISEKYILELCSIASNACTPSDLVQQLHREPMGLGSYDLSISDPSVQFFRYGWMGMGWYEHNIQIFYDKDANKIIGWVSYGETAVYKNELKKGTDLLK